MKNIVEMLADGHDPKGGLYLHLLQPTARIVEPGKSIEAGASVTKHGKFISLLSRRMKQYDDPKYWHYESTGEAAFITASTRSYLIFDASGLVKEDLWLITGLEQRLGELVVKHFNVLAKVGKGKSEYKMIEFTDFQNYDSVVNLIYKEINQIAARCISAGSTLI
jgi:hypothetical protein